MNKLLASLALVLGLTAGASAQQLVLGFRDVTPGNAGSATNITVNLGDVSTFTGSTATLVTNVSSYLTSTYGAGWASDAGLLWGVAGAALNNDLWGTATTTTSTFDGVTASSVAPAPVSTNALSNTDASAAVSSVYTVTTGSLTANYQTIDPTLNGWSTNGGFSTGLAFAIFDGSTFETAGAGAADLWSMTSAQVTGSGKNRKTVNGTNTFVGTFKLLANGDLWFYGTSAAAIPEPSTYAGLLGLATAGIVVLRRRQKAVTA